MTAPHAGDFQGAILWLRSLEFMGSFFFVQLCLLRLIPVLCGVILSWVAWVCFIAGFFQIQALKKLQYSAVCFWCIDFWWATVCASMCRSVAVGGMQVWQHFWVLWDRVCVWSLCSCAEGWGAVWLIWKWRERVVFLHRRGESRQGAGSLWDSLCAPAVFDLTPPLCCTPYYSIEHTHLLSILKHRLALHRWDSLPVCSTYRPAQG